MIKYEALSIMVGVRPSISFRVRGDKGGSGSVTVQYNSEKERNAALDFARQNFSRLSDLQLIAVFVEVRNNAISGPEPISEF